MINGRILDRDISFIQWYATNVLHLGSCEICPCLVFWKLHVMPLGNNPRVKLDSPKRWFSPCLKVRADSVISVILQYVAGESRRQNPMWSKTLLRGKVCLPAARPVHGESVEKESSSITLLYPPSNGLSSFKSCGHNQVSCDAWKRKEQVYLYFYCAIRT